MTMVNSGLKGLIEKSYIYISGIDMVFLKKALGMTHKAVYSLHKTSTRNVCIFCGLLHVLPSIIMTIIFVNA